MAPETLKARLQPAIDQDLDEVWDRWSASVDDPDPVSFVQQLVDWEILSRLDGGRVIADLQDEGPSPMADDTITVQHAGWIESRDGEAVTNLAATETMQLPRYVDEDIEDAETGSYEDLSEEASPAVLDSLAPAVPSLPPPTRSGSGFVLPNTAEMDARTRLLNLPPSRDSLAPTTVRDPAPHGAHPTAPPRRSWLRSLFSGGLTTLALLLLLGTVSMLVSGAGVAGALWQRHESDTRARRLVTTLTLAAAQANRVEGRLLSLKGPLTATSVLVSEGLDEGARGPRVLRAPSDFAGDAPAPPGATAQTDAEPLGPGWVSPQIPAILVPEGVADADAAAVAGVLSRHVPRHLAPRPAAAYLWVGLDSGLYATLPGHVGAGDDHDPRTDPIYAAIAEAEGPAWLARRGGRVVVAEPILRRGQLAGVAAIDVSPTWLVDNLLPVSHRGVDGVVGILLDTEGALIAQTSALPMPPNPAVVAAAQSGGSGYVFAEMADKEVHLFVYHHLAALGWTHVVQGPEAVLLR